VKVYPNYGYDYILLLYVKIPGERHRSGNQQLVSRIPVSKSQTKCFNTPDYEQMERFNAECLCEKELKGKGSDGSDTSQQRNGRS
jgi:hypothetical protein